MRSLLMAIIGCLRAADRHQVEIRTRTAPYQLVRRLLELAEQQHSDTIDQDADIDLRISQEELGRQVGCCTHNGAEGVERIVREQGG